MKRITSVILLSILFSCSDSKEVNQFSKTNTNAVTDTTNLDDTVDSNELINNTHQANPTTELTDLRGKAFVLGGGIDDNICEITEACDCCNADLMFISEKLFVYDDHCEGHFVRKGNYRLEGNQITLEFEPQIVSYYHNEESEINPNAPKSILKSENKPIPMETYSIGKCKEFTIITNSVKSEDTAFPVGILKESSTMQEKVDILKQIGIWKMLALK